MNYPFSNSLTTVFPEMQMYLFSKSTGCRCVINGSPVPKQIRYSYEFKDDFF